MITQIIQGAPAWIWVLLGIIITRGVRALSARVVYLPTFFIVPVVLVVLRLAYGIESNMILYYFLGLAAGIIVGYLKTEKQLGITINKKNMEVALPGSPELLIVLFTFFCIRYLFGYLEAMHEEVVFDYMWIEYIMTGSVIGFLWGNAVSYVHRYMRL